MRNRVFLNSPRIQLSIALSLMMALAVSLTGCGGGGGGSSSGTPITPPANPLLATIKGVVKDTSPNHNAVSGALITVTGTGRTALTDATGTFVVTNVPLTATSFSVASPNSANYFNYANYNGKEYDLINCVLKLPTLAAGANAPYTDVDLYIGGNNPPPPPPVGGCPS